MSFLDAFVGEYAKRHFPGREFAVYSDLETNGWVVKDHTTGRRALIPRRLFSLRPNAENMRAVARILDEAFDTRTELEKMPWQLFQDYVR